MANFDDASALKILLVDGQEHDADPLKIITNTMVMLRQMQKMDLLPMKELSLVQEL
jgi:hypothetical protein